jgi:hypothetical protein
MLAGMSANERTAVEHDGADGEGGTTVSPRRRRRAVAGVMAGVVATALAVGLAVFLFDHSDDDTASSVERSASADSPDEVLEVADFALVRADEPAPALDLTAENATLDASGCFAVRAAIAGFGDNAEGLATARLPGLNLNATFENVRATIRCGVDNSLTLTGTLRTEDLVTSVSTRLGWPDTSTAIPEVRLTATLDGTSDGGLLKLSDLVVPVAGLIGADLAAGDLPSDLTLTSLAVDAWWPREGDAWLDLTAGTTLTTNRGSSAGVNLLASITTPRAAPDPTVLWGLHVTPPSGTTVDLESLLANDSLSWLGGVQFPELLLGYVTPGDRTVTLADLPTDRTLPRTFFAGKQGELTTNPTFDATLRATATVDLDSLGDDLRTLVGYGPGARAVMNGELGIRVGDVLKGDGRVEVTGVTADITLPSADGAAGSLLPAGVRLGATRIDANWQAATATVEATVNANASVDLPDPSKPGGVITLNPALTARFEGPSSGDVRARLTGTVPGTAAAPAWPDVFGLGWFDLTEAGITLAANPTGAEVSAFGEVNLGGAATRVDLRLNATAPRTELNVDATTPDAIPLAQLARQWGVTLSDEFDLTVGGSAERPARLQGRLAIDDDGKVSGGLGFRAASTLTLGTSDFDAEVLLAVAFEPDGSTNSFGGARLGTTTIANLTGAFSTDLGRELGRTNLGAVNLPTTGLVFANTGLQAPSSELSTDQRAFFDPLFGCTASRPCTYTVDLAPGVHFLSDFALPRQPGSTTKVLFEDVYRAFWMDEPPTAQFRLSLTLPQAGRPLVSEGLEARIDLGIRPDPERRADWFRAADLGVGLQVTATGLNFELGGRLGIRLLDETRSSNEACADKTWVADSRPGGGGCYDELDIAVASMLAVGTTNRFTLAGSVIAERGWRQPLGIDFLELSALVAQIDVRVDAAGPSFQFGFNMSGKIITERGDRDLAGSFVVGLRPVPTAPFVVPTFGGLRVSSRGGLDLADLMLLAGTAPSQAPDVTTPPADLPTVSLRNAEFMVGTADFPSLCITTGVRFSGELYVGVAPVRVTAPGETPRTCRPQPTTAPVACRTAAAPCTAAVNLRSDSTGIALVGVIDKFSVGRVQWSNAEVVFDLTSTAPRLRLAGQASVTGLGRGGLELEFTATRSLLVGDIELFAPAGAPTKVPPLKASVSATLTSGTTGTAATEFDLLVRLQSDVGLLVRTIATDKLREFVDTAILLDWIYRDLKANDGDVLRTLRTVPRQLHEQGVRVPTWVYNPQPFTFDLTVAAGYIDDFVTKNRLPRPTFGQIFSGTPLNPPVFGISRIAGIKDFIPSAPGSFTEFLDTVVEPALENALRRRGVPVGWSFEQAIADLQASIDGIDIPIVISCAEFRLALGGTGTRATMRVAGEAFENPIGLSIAFDTSKSFWDQLSSIGPTLVRQLFVEPAVVGCDTSP